MPTIVTLTSAADTIVFHPTPDVTGFVYNNTTLDAWYKLASPNSKTSKRPNAHGSYGLGQIFTGSHFPVVNGQYFGTTATDALVARNRLVAMFNDGNAVTMTVADDLETTTRTVWMIDHDAPFHYDFSHFVFDLVFEAPDARRYAAAVVDEEGLPSASSGLLWPLGTTPGVYWDWGTAGVLGQVQFTNTGGTATHPLLEVGNAGGFDVGFVVTEVETGRELRMVRSTGTTDVVRLDSRTGRATLNGGDVTGALTRREWFSIPAGATRRYQINTLGSTTGAPTIKLTAASAYL